MTSSLRANHGNIDKRGETAELLPYVPFPSRPFHLVRGNEPLSSKRSNVASGRKKRSDGDSDPELNGKLPRLKHTVSSRRKEKQTNMADVVEKTRIAQNTSTSSDASSKSLSGIHLHDELSISSLRLHSRGNHQNGIILNQPLASATLLHVSTLPTHPRSLSSGALEERMKKVKQSSEEADPDLHRSSSSLRDTKDIATQTHDRRKSIKVVEFVEEDQQVVRGTQTDNVPVLLTARRRSSVLNPEELEERGALLEIIEDALDQTIDRYSRVRANQAIAASARRQAQIWRDAKEFISSTLLPQSIQLANRSRAQKRTAADIVANIRMYP